jgi:outer membrane immunogenic protein
MTRATNLALAIAGVSALFVASQASAAEPFNGPYIGAQAGWQHDSNRFTLRGATGSASDHMSGSSFTYGAQLGYDFKPGDSFVIGAEAFVTGDTNKVRDGDSSFDGGRALGLLARAGVLATPRTLIYAKGGWENGRFTYRENGIGVSTNRDGWSLGGGVEQMVTDNVSARVEYRYTRFNSFNSSALDAALGSTAEARVDRDRVLVGVNYRF